MKQLLFSFSIILACTALLGSCRQPSGKSKPDPVLEDFRKNLAGADSCWNVMMISDDGKIQNMERLASELLLIDGSDSVAISGIRAGISNLKQGRYSKFSIRHSGSIDAYDSISTGLISGLKKEVSRNPKSIEFQIVNQLVQEISQADDSVLFYRKEYDRFADRLNLMLKKNGRRLKSEIKGLDTVSSFPVFRLIP